MSISSLLDGGGREICYRSEFGKGHLRNGGLDTKVSSRGYADRRRRPLEFEVGDRVILKVMLKRGAIRFGKRGKILPRYIGPFEVLDRVGTGAYRLTLPQGLLGVHAVFHVSMLRKYTPDPTYVGIGVSSLLMQMRPLRRDLCVL